MRSLECPKCRRVVRNDYGQFPNHSTRKGGKQLCTLSNQPIPAAGLSDGDYERRAQIVTHLANQLQDQDPSLVGDYLTVIPAEEKDRLLIVALAGIDVDRPVSEIFGWVTGLPAARTA